MVALAEEEVITPATGTVAQGNVAVPSNSMDVVKQNPITNAASGGKPIKGLLDSAQASSVTTPTQPTPISPLQPPPPFDDGGGGSGVDPAIQDGLVASPSPGLIRDPIKVADPFEFRTNLIPGEPLPSIPTPQPIGGPELPAPPVPARQRVNPNINIPVDSSATQVNPITPQEAAQTGVNSAGAGFISQARDAQTATATGGAVVGDDAATYDGRTGAQILDESQNGLIDMLQRDNPLMALERAKGRRFAESRGLGSSSFAGRAAEGAAIDAAMPLVQQATQLGSQERITAQSLTAQAKIAESNRNLTALLQEQQLAVQSGDSAKARELESSIQTERNNLTSALQTQGLDFQGQETASQRNLTSQLEANRNNLNALLQEQQLAVQSGDAAKQRELSAQISQAQIQSQLLQQERALDTQISENDLQRKFQDLQQDKDIDYKKWLEGATFGHQQILQTNQQAAQFYGAFTDNAAEIMNNENTTSAQKTAALAALREGLTGSLIMLEGISGVDLAQYAPLGYNALVNPLDNPVFGSPFFNPPVGAPGSPYPGPLAPPGTPPATPGNPTTPVNPGPSYPPTIPPFNLSGGFG